jgi:hypothetical protein
MLVMLEYGSLNIKGRDAHKVELQLDYIVNGKSVVATRKEKFAAF